MPRQTTRLAAALGIASLTALGAVAATSATAAPTGTQEYVVILKDPADHLRMGRSAQVAQLTSDAVAEARSLGAEVTDELRALGGYMARLTPQQAERLAASDRVQSLGPDLPITLADTRTNAASWVGPQAAQGVRAAGVQDNPKWHLDRLDQTTTQLDKKYAYPTTGKGVHLYIMDTGIRATHQEFVGRVGQGYNVIAGNDNPEDDQSHGTHVASIAMGSIYGAAKEATVHAVKVMNGGGMGSVSAATKGMDWIIANGTKPGVANMSFTLPQEYAPLNDATKKLVAAGYSAVIAAGNNRRDACSHSPAMVPEAVTVGASAKGITGNAQQDSLYVLGNFGRCLDILSPGDFIEAAGHKSDTEVVNKSGTSMASPLTAGVIAMYLEKFPQATPAQVQEALVKGGITGMFQGLPAGTPNLLLNVNYLK